MAIYYLDVDDEITSAAARIRDSSDNRIALVLSGGSRVATSRINFRLLAREAKHRGKRLAIIAADPSVQSVARSAELPVFASVGDYEKSEAAMSRGPAGRQSADVSDALGELALTVKPAASKALTRVAGAPAGPGRVGSARVSRPVLAGIGALLILALAAAAFFFYPSASVVLTLRGDPVGPLTLSVKVDPTVATANDQAGVVPGLSKAFPVEASGTFNATGQNVVDTAATGTVTFTSYNTYLDVPILAGTQVTTSKGVAFITSSNITVRHATYSGSFTPGTADVGVTAANKGTAGNVAAGTIVNAPSQLDSALVNSHPVTNKAPTTGGTHTVTPEIQQSDIDGAAATLLSELEAAFQDAMNAQGAVPSGSTMFDQSAKLAVAVCNPDPQGLLGQAVASFQLDCQDTGTVTLAAMATVRGLAVRRIHAAVESGYSIVSGSESASVGSPFILDGNVVVPVVVEATQVPSVDIEKLRSAIEGKSLGDARSFLAQYGLADISVSPSWSSTMPSFDFRIDVQLVVPPASPGPGASASAIPSAAVPVTIPSPTQAAASPSSAPAPSASPAASPSAGGSPSPLTSPSPSASPGPGATPSPSPLPS
ncbi:MAG: baseplate J/gp47 family protein [Candidatus Limnocylindrales bacterium]